MRRVWSISQLTFREALKSKVLLSCAFFTIVVVLVRLAVFAAARPATEPTAPTLEAQSLMAEEDTRTPGGRSVAWFRVEQYTHLALLLILLTGIVVTIVIVAPSLSHDIKTKVIYTIIPKPVHRMEILLGKVLGFSAVVALILAVIGAVTLGVTRLTIGAVGEDGRRLFAAEVKVPATSISFSGGYLSYMKRSDRRWLNPDYIETEEDRREREEMNLAKVVPGEAIVTFERIHARDLGGQPLRFEIALGVYRFGGAAGEDPEISVTVVNRTTGERAMIGRDGLFDTDREPFRIRENVPRRLEVPATFIGDGATVDLLIRNLAYKHRVGVRRTDVMLLLGDRSYVGNFVKSLLILFLEVLVVIVIAVMSSTFLSGLIAILFTATAWVGGHLLGWMSELLGQWARGGQGPMAEIGKEFGHSMYTPSGPLDWIFDFTNEMFAGVLTVASHLFPNLGHFANAWLVAQNVDISAAMVWRAALFSVLYSAVCFAIAYVVFRVKEVAK